MCVCVCVCVCVCMGAGGVLKELAHATVSLSSVNYVVQDSGLDTKEKVGVVALSLNFTGQEGRPEAQAGLDAVVLKWDWGGL